MEIIAVIGPRDTDWQWRMVNDSGDMIEESSTGFATIGAAVAAGTVRLRQREREDVVSISRSTYHRR